MATGVNGWIAVAKDIPAAVPCQHSSQNRCSIDCLWLSMVDAAGLPQGGRGCNIWALGAIWKKQAWPERFGVEKRHWAFAGEQPFEGVSPYSPCSPGPIQPRSLGFHLLCTLHRGKMCPCLLGEALAPSSHPGLGGEWHVWRGGRIPEPSEMPRGAWLKIALLTKGSFSLSPVIPSPGGRRWLVWLQKLQRWLLHSYTRADPRQEALVSSSLKAVVNLASSSPR